jgi:hypothetical protein
MKKTIRFTGTATFLVALAAVLATGCATSPPPAPAPPRTPTQADVSFEAISQRYLNEMMALMPVNATSLGDHRFDGELDDVSSAGYDRRAALAHELLLQLQALDTAELSRANQVDAQLLTNELQYQIWRIEQLAEWRWNPLIYTDLAGNGVYLLMARDFAPLSDRLRNVGARLAELPRFLAQVRESLVPARVPKIHAETAIKQNNGVLSLIDQLVIPQLAAVPDADQASLKKTIAHARTAVAQHQIWLEKKLLPEANGDFRLGATLYDTKLRFALDSPMTRQEIRTRAEAELVRTRGEMYDIARTVLQKRPDAPPLPPNPSADEQQAAIAAALEMAYADQPPRDQVFETARRAFTQTTAFTRAHDLVTIYDDPLADPRRLDRRAGALLPAGIQHPLDRRPHHP